MNVSATASIPTGVDVAPLTGPLAIANLINWGLFGILTVQAYIYYIAFPKDNLKLQSVIIVVYVLEMVQVILTTHDFYVGVAADWGNLSELDEIRLDWLSIPVFSALVSCLSQIFYAWRISILSGRYWVPFFVTLVALAQVSIGVYIGFMDEREVHLSSLQFNNTYYRFCTAWLSLCALCDTTITGSMVFYLWIARNSTAIEKTTTLLTRLIKLTVETGFVCTAVNMVSLIFLLKSRTTFLYVVFVVVTSKLYSNCLLAVLNTRVRILGGRNTYRTDESFTGCLGIMRGLSEGNNNVGIELQLEEGSSKHGSSTRNIFSKVNEA